MVREVAGEGFEHLAAAAAPGSAQGGEEPGEQRHQSQRAGEDQDERDDRYGAGRGQEVVKHEVQQPLIGGLLAPHDLMPGKY